MIERQFKVVDAPGWLSKPTPGLKTINGIENLKAHLLDLLPIWAGIQSKQEFVTPVKISVKDPVHGWCGFTDTCVINGRFTQPSCDHLPSIPFLLKF